MASARSAPAPSRQGAGSRSPACSSAGSPRPDPAEEELVGAPGSDVWARQAEGLVQQGHGHRSR